MSVTLPDVRKGLAATLKAHTGTEAHPYAKAMINLPCIIPATVDVEPVTQYDGGQMVTFSLWCCVAATHDEFQQKLDEYVVGQSSVTAAIDAHPTLGLGNHVSATWTSAGNYSLTEWGGTPLWAAVVDVEVQF